MVKVTRISSGATMEIVFNAIEHPALFADGATDEGPQFEAVLSDEAAAVLQGDSGLAAHFVFEPVDRD